MTEEKKPGTPPEDRADTVNQEGESTKAKQKAEEAKKEVGEGEGTKIAAPRLEEDPSKRKEDQKGGSTPTLENQKDAESPETKTATTNSEEKTTTPPSASKQSQQKQPYVQYVPPYRAIVRGLTGDAVGSRQPPKDSKTNYRDYSKMADPVPDGRNRGGVAEVFPVKLHRMLRQTEFEGKGNVVSFCSHGRAFMIHNPMRFQTEVMPKFFRQTRVQSFQRQLNLYGFKRITRGPDTGGYYHELFLRGRPGLCVNMQRTRIKGVPKGPDDPSSEPDFYSMPAMRDSGNSLPAPVPMGNMPTPIFPSYLYPMPQGVAGPYTIAQTQPTGFPPSYNGAPFAKTGATGMPLPYGVYPFAYPMYNPQQIQDNASPRSETKPKETTAENVDIFLQNADGQKATV